ncbi:hypothetical protein niasHS_010275 [Heterodera schachtii]|uniref:phosphatidylinositol-3,5-bisphosphate 3-phosphatase n=1 Tax=Heterodera schachtii TaxID=97005 RepID=A0ABD2J0U9_HETSC
MNSNFYIKQVQLIDPFSSEAKIIGTIHVLGTHFIFKADEGGKEIWVPHTLIALIDRAQPTLSGSRLTIRCKHFLVLVLLLAKDRDCQSLYETLLRCSRLTNISECLAFANKKGNCSPDNWSRLNWADEFRRQGVDDDLNNGWTVSQFNTNYAHCDTYPEQLWIPRGATTQILIASCRFRSRARLPVLTYFYGNNGAALCRSSQPLAGFSARCLEDESLMELIMAANPSSTHLYLIDTRPRVNAMVNKVQGKGFEDTRNYTNIQFHFFDIENIHVMRASLNKLLEACQRTQTMTQYLKIVDACGWLRHLKTLIDCSVFIAESILRGISCVIHCSDGWDRTSQTVSLAQLVIDPFYRTVKGFQVLVDKDWLGFGFKFDDRCGHLGTSAEEMAKEVSPIFTQFLDCVYQLLRKKPMFFEFNERFLVELNEHAYSCVYGQFVGNCDKDRKDLRTVSKTNSLWAHMDLHIDDYLNPFYDPNRNEPFLCDIELSLSSFAVWTNLYNRFDVGIQPREYLSDIFANAKLHLQSMKKMVAMPETDSECPRVSFAWQPLLNADECANEKCRREFLSRIERRVHCQWCGQIYCHRCIRKRENSNNEMDNHAPVCVLCMQIAC